MDEKPSDKGQSRKQKREQEQEQEREQGQEQEEDPMVNFRYGLRAPDTKRQYPRRFQYFLIYLKIEGTLEEQAKAFLRRARQNPQWAQNSLMSYIEYQKERVKKNELAESTITNYYKATKLFCVMNDLSLNWKKIARGLPTGRRAANDRAPTTEELQKLIEFPDRRVKPIVYTMISCGFRIGSWDYLKWKHITPIENEKGEVIAAKIIVYAEDSEEYYSFITPQAYHSLKEWMDFRVSYGEKITGESWVMRDIWQTTNTSYGARWGLATCPRKLKSSGIKRLIEHALWEQGLRQPLQKGEKRHEWKAAHGMRKYCKSKAEQVMKPINVWLILDHDTGVSESYYKPLEREVLADYLKAIPLLTLGNYHEQQSQVEKQRDDEVKTLRREMDAIVSLFKDMVENPKLGDRVLAITHTIKEMGDEKKKKLGLGENEPVELGQELSEVLDKAVRMGK